MTTALYTLILVGSLTVRLFNTRERRHPRDLLALLIVAAISLSRDPSVDMTFPRYLRWSTVFSLVPSMVMIGGGPVEPGGGGVLESGFAGYVPLASQNPHPIIVYSVASYRPHLSHFWANVIAISRMGFNAS